MDLINCPLLSFAVCADPNAGARQQAKIRHETRLYEYKGNQLKFWNKETSFKTQEDLNVIGHSRDKSDIQVAMEVQQGKSFLATESLARKFAKEQFVDEGGRSRTAGRNKYLDLLNKQGQLDSKLSAFAGRGQAIAEIGAQRKYDSMVAKNRQSLGAPPAFGAPTIIPGRDVGGMIMNAGKFAVSAITAGATVAIASDKRLKENIKEVGKSPKGHTIYEWNYKSNPHSRYRGAIAQDVMKTDPMAVDILPNGLLGIYYDKIDVDMEKVA